MGACFQLWSAWQPHPAWLSGHARRRAPIHAACQGVAAEKPGQVARRRRFRCCARDEPEPDGSAGRKGFRSPQAASSSPLQALDAREC